MYEASCASEAERYAYHSTYMSPPPPPNKQRNSRGGKRKKRKRIPDWRLYQAFRLAVGDEQLLPEERPVDTDMNASTVVDDMPSAGNAGNFMGGGGGVAVRTFLLGLFLVCGVGTLWLAGCSL